MFERIAARLTINVAIIALIALAFVAQTIRIEGFKVWPISHKGLKAELKDARDELARIGSKRNDQRETSERTVTKVVEGQERVRTVVRTIEAAPNPENCKTPALPELRNVL